jgi:hypothetical protein
MENAKQRHGCLTAWLVMMIIANALTAVATPLLSGFIQKTLPNYPTWTIWPLTLIGVLNIAFVIALFNWKMWGFHGFASVAVITFSINIYSGIGIGSAFVGFLGVVLLYGVLQIGGDKKGWPQLE